MQAFTKIFSTLVITLMMLANLNACSIYRKDIEQGNFFTEEMVNKLYIGMDKMQVETILGSPLQSQLLRKDRIDYYYLDIPGDGRKAMHRQIILHFKNGLLAKIDKVQL